MRKIIEQILEGNFDYENGSLDFSCTKIEISLNRGEVYEGSFHIYAPQGRFTNGTVLSSDLRMECVTADFVGSEEEIFFRFHAEDLEEGDVVKGNFFVISNQGEYCLPFAVSVSPIVLESSMGAVRNLFHFANLAKASWKEAVSLFYSPEFHRVFTGGDAQYWDAYRALSAYPDSEQNVEEFLIRVNKKQKVEFLVQEEALTLDVARTSGAYAVLEKELTIVRNGWGYTRLQVECEGEFLFTEKAALTDDDFLGNRCTLPVFIDSSLCREGKSFGRIFLYNSYVSLTVPVTVRKGDHSAGRAVGMMKKRNTVQLMEFYQAFRTRKISTGTWLKETRKLVEKQVAVNDNDIAARLFQAQLLITEESYNEAGWILDHVAELLEEGEGDDTLLAYYLYLTTLIHREEKYVDEVAADVERIYRKDNRDWRVAWLLLYLSEEYHKSATGKWVFLEKQYHIGCTSPILYIEAVALLNNNPALLRRLGGFERQALWYGARQELLRQEVVEQLLYLCERVKEYSGVLYKILVRLYEKRSDVRLLQQICALLIKGGKTGTACFSWYSAGVQNNLRITNLYEYYVMSLDMRKPQEIPKHVLLYFSYQNNLDYEHTAYLYDYILRNEDRLGDLYETYRIRMEHFCLEQISRLHMNRYLADIYNRLLQPEMIAEQNCRQLSKLLYAHMLCVEDGRIRRAYVYQPGNLCPAEYVLNEGRAWISLYGGDYTIAFEDAWENRFVRSVEYTVERLMSPGKFLSSLLAFPIENPDLELYLCAGGQEGGGIDSDESADRARRVAESGYADGQLRRELTLRLLQYYYDKDDMRALDEYLPQVSPDMLTGKERGEVLRFMVLRGGHEQAWQWLRRYGPYFADAKLLVRLLSPLMEKNDMEEDEFLTAAAAYAFQRGKYDSVMLRYLALYYRGTTKDMRDIWRAAKSFETDCYRLCETLLIQMLYSGAFVEEKMEIFCDYISQGAKPEVEEALLAQCSFEYFVKERAAEKVIFDEIERMYFRGEPVRKVCELAYLKYYAENRDGLTDRARELTGAFLAKLMDQGIRLEFFREYKDQERAVRELYDKTIIEYRANPRGRACIHYVIVHENGESDEYSAEYMREVCGGVCFKEFILFFGESLQYYITEERDGEEQLTESGTLQRGDIRGSGSDSRYQLINDIVISKTLQDYDAMDNLLEEYYKKEFLNTRLFELK